MNCLRCNSEMKFLGKEDIQLGHVGFLTGTLGNLFSGSLAVEIFLCPACGKIEFFSDEKDKLSK
ncbi:MAG: hypothetical protein VB120_05280 [Lachnospiraceae bacterium]|nr:hypothetical protein [Lachnospiraceae bacterium]